MGHRYIGGFLAAGLAIFATGFLVAGLYSTLVKGEIRIYSGSFEILDSPIRLFVTISFRELSIIAGNGFLGYREDPLNANGLIFPRCRDVLRRVHLFTDAVIGVCCLMGIIALFSWFSTLVPSRRAWMAIAVNGVCVMISVVLLGVCVGHGLYIVNNYEKCVQQPQELPSIPPEWIGPFTTTAPDSNSTNFTSTDNSTDTTATETATNTSSTTTTTTTTVAAVSTTPARRLFQWASIQKDKQQRGEETEAKKSSSSSMKEDKNRISGIAMNTVDDKVHDVHVGPPSLSSLSSSSSLRRRLLYTFTLPTIPNRPTKPSLESLEGKLLPAIRDWYNALPVEGRVAFQNQLLTGLIGGVSADNFTIGRGGIALLVGIVFVIFELFACIALFFIYFFECCDYCGGASTMKKRRQPKREHESPADLADPRSLLFTKGGGEDATPAAGSRPPNSEGDGNDEELTARASPFGRNNNTDGNNNNDNDIGIGRRGLSDGATELGLTSAAGPDELNNNNIDNDDYRSPIFP